ncbi:epidermal growth factor receptor kinase substrate 8-like protein 1a isoform X1 [Tachysurus vachellii]|uniref:epidermal growth factor receptor kinase substrate 8-like protein 1a isoform X1 n=2 Tax=Tachysurus vachellii TaxID=175792 RepID=UPI00296A970E|nr:epidermal growth factor receptor kinase substrate 8-like protein 1a isoform X1 [Tachysurus vachellii]
MSASTMNPPAVVPRKHSLLRPLPQDGQPIYTRVKEKERVRHPEHEVELLNHCISDVERFMAHLQQAADAQRTLQDMKKKKNSKKKKQGYDVMTTEVIPPSEQEFVDIFQKIKYSFSLLDCLKTDIADPTSKELLHHLFVPLALMVKTTGGPDLAAGVSSPALTNGAISLLQQNLMQDERELWSSLGPNWTQAKSQHAKSAYPYAPVFLDGWKPDAFDANGQAFEDPVESQNKKEALLQRQQSEFSPPSSPLQLTDESVEIPLPDQLYRCSYDFVARNSSELSVLHGETLQVLDSSKRWWKCRNNYDQIGFVPSNILEPVKETDQDYGVVMRKPSMNVPLSPMGVGRFSYMVPNSVGGDHVDNEPRSVSMPPMGSDGERAMLMNIELVQRLANGRPGSVRPPVINKASDTTVPLNYHSSPAEVQEWLRGKGFRNETVNSLGVLDGAQLFSLNKEELCKVSPQEGARVYSQITVQKSQLEVAERNTTELEAVMRKQKMKVDPSVEGGEF